MGAAIRRQTQQNFRVGVKEEEMSQGDTKLQVLISDGQMEDRGDKVSLSTCALLQRIKHGKDLNRLYGSCLL